MIWSFYQGVRLSDLGVATRGRPKRTWIEAVNKEMDLLMVQKDRNRNVAELEKKE